MKFAVHWAPSVNSCTPGWMAALDDGAHVGAALAAVPAASGARHPTASSTAEAEAPFRRPVAQETRTYPSLLLATPVYPLGSGTKPPFWVGSWTAIPGRCTPVGDKRREDRGALSGLAQRRPPRPGRRRLRHPDPRLAGPHRHGPRSALRRVRARRRLRPPG